MQVRMIGGVAMDAATNVENLTALKFAEQFALWSFRFWYRCVASDVHPQAKLMEAYTVIGDTNAAIALDDAMWTVFSSWCGPCRIMSTRCETLSGDEKRILSIVAAAQHGLATTQRERIAEFVTPACEDLCLSRMRAWAEGLLNATLILPIRDWRYDCTPRKGKAGETEAIPAFSLVPAAPMRH